MHQLSSLLKSRLERQFVDISPDALVKIHPLESSCTIPCVVEPKVEDFDLIGWANVNRKLVTKLLMTYRAILFKRCGIESAALFHELINATSSGEMLECRDRSTPRREVENRIYTSTEYPPDQAIALHNKGTYWMRWPLLIYFCCKQPALTGGETPIADVRRVLSRIPPQISGRFKEKKILY